MSLCREHPARGGDGGEDVRGGVENADVVLVVRRKPHFASRRNRSGVLVIAGYRGARGVGGVSVHVDIIIRESKF